MSFKLRSVNTKFWEDPFVENIKPEEKLLFLYFLTNPLTNLIGIYEITIKRISYDTGLTPERIHKSLKVFHNYNKVYYIDNYIILPNFIKNQNFNTNMKKGAMNNYDSLPNSLKDKLYDKPLEAFESLSNTLEIEYKVKDECKVKDNSNINIEFDVFWNMYNKKVGSKSNCEKKWRSLKNGQRTKIIESLPLFLSSIKDKQYQPFPETYLNQNRWDDEIMKSKPETTLDVQKQRGQFGFM